MDTVGRWTGRESRCLRQALRLTVRSFAEDLGVSPRTVTKWETIGSSRKPRPEMQAALDTMLERASESERARFHETIANGTDSQPPPERGQPASLPVAPSPNIRAASAADAVGASASSAAGFALWWESVSSGPVSLDLMLSELRRLAGDYLDQPPEPVVLGLRDLRDGLFDLLRRPQAPSHARDLHLLSGFANVLLGWFSSDLGQLGAADTHTQVAALFAETSGSAELGAWVQAVRSKTAFWSGDLPLAARHALVGLATAPATTVQVLLAAQAADAWSVLGAADEADEALGQLLTVREATAVSDTVGGLLSCSPAREANYLSGIYQQLGRLPEAIQVADDALALSRRQQVRSYATEAQIQLNRVDIFLDQGDLEAAREAFGVLLQLPSDRRLHTLTRRVGQLGEVLKTPGFANQPGAQDLARATTDFIQGSAGSVTRRVAG